MKVLFVGEGMHDIGVTGKSPNQPRIATSVVSVLARKAAPSIDSATGVMRWTDTDIDELKRHCQQGFKPFAEALAKAFTPL